MKFAYVYRNVWFWKCCVLNLKKMKHENVTTFLKNSCKITYFPEIDVYGMFLFFANFGYIKMCSLVSTEFLILN